MPGAGKLFSKYAVALAGLVGAILVLASSVQIFFSYRENRAAIEAVEREKATGAAQRIEFYIQGVVDQIAMAMFPGLDAPSVSTVAQRFELRKLLRQVPAIVAITRLDSFGHEHLRVSRVELDLVGSGRDHSHERPYLQARRGGTYYGPVYFQHGTEPYMNIAIAPSLKATGVAVAEVDLRTIWDVISQVRLGRTGYAFVVDSRGRLVAHPDSSLVFRETDFSNLPHVAQALGPDRDVGRQRVSIAVNAQNQRVLVSWTRIPALGWSVFVEQPLVEAFKPVYASVARSALLLAFGLALAVFASLVLARQMVKPIQELHTGAARISQGILDQDIRISTGDELEALGNQFNLMATRLRELYATLEQKVKDRTRQLELANVARSRLIAAASHDLRQPLHALGLFVAQWRNARSASEKRRIVARVETAVSALEGLFDSLLDISRLDAGVLLPEMASFPLDPVLKRVEATFSETARNKGLRLRVSSSRAWVYSDQIMLERILNNLVSNALRYTSRGGVVLGVRNRQNQVRIEVWDSGVGIPQAEQQRIFEEFYQVEGARKEGGGLGLGLAIVDRLSQLLGCSIELVSVVGKGSRFTINVPAARPLPMVKTEPRPTPPMGTAISATRVLVVDDDPLALDSVAGLLASWGCRVLTAGTAGEALAAVGNSDEKPELIVCDYRLTDGETGVQLIARLRREIGAIVPAVLVTGDPAQMPLHESEAEGCPLLAKPLSPMTLRAVINSVISKARGR